MRRRRRRLNARAVAAPSQAAGTGAPGVGGQPPWEADPSGHSTHGELPKPPPSGLKEPALNVKAEAGAANKNRAVNATCKLRVMIEQKTLTKSVIDCLVEACCLMQDAHGWIALFGSQAWMAKQVAIVAIFQIAICVKFWLVVVFLHVSVKLHLLCLVELQTNYCKLILESQPLLP